MEWDHEICLDTALDLMDHDHRTRSCAHPVAVHPFDRVMVERTLTSPTGGQAASRYWCSNCLMPWRQTIVEPPAWSPYP